MSWAICQCMQITNVVAGTLGNQSFLNMVVGVSKGFSQTAVGISTLTLGLYSTAMVEPIKRLSNMIYSGSSNLYCQNRSHGSSVKP